MSVMAVLLLILIGVLAWLVWQRDGGAEAAPEAAAPEAAAPAADSAAPVP
jgi:hypothetical protein